MEGHEGGPWFTADLFSGTHIELGLTVLASLEGDPLSLESLAGDPHAPRCDNQSGRGCRSHGRLESRTAPPSLVPYVECRLQAGSRHSKGGDAHAEPVDMKSHWLLCSEGPFGTNPGGPSGPPTSQNRSPRLIFIPWLPSRISSKFWRTGSMNWNSAYYSLINFGMKSLSRLSLFMLLRSLIRRISSICGRRSMDL